jgi:hypothetical protein
MTDYNSLLRDLFTAPARGMTAQPPQADFGSGLLGSFLTKAHGTLDPVQAMGGYGNLAAMAFPPGAWPKPLPLGRTRYRTLAPAIKFKEGVVTAERGKHHVDVMDAGEAAGKTFLDDGWVDQRTGQYLTRQEVDQLFTEKADRIGGYLDARRRRR